MKLGEVQDDAHLASELADSMRARGVDVWLDRDIPAGGSIADVLWDRLRSADAFVVLLSPTSASSTWLSTEIATALSFRADDPTKKIIPVLTEPGVSVPPILHDVQALRLEGDQSSRDRAADRLVEAVLRQPPATEISSTRAEDFVNDRFAELVRSELIFRLKVEAQTARLRLFGAVTAFTLVIATAVTAVVLALNDHAIGAVTVAVASLASVAASVITNVIAVKQPSEQSARGQRRASSGE